MTGHLVAVVCRECKGTGNAPDGVLCCPWCVGMGHESVDRDAHGNVPAGFVEWIPPLLPEGPPPYQRCC